MNNASAYATEYKLYANSRIIRLISLYFHLPCLCRPLRSIPAEKEKWLSTVDALTEAIASAIDAAASTAGTQQQQLSEHIRTLQKTALEMEIHHALSACIDMFVLYFGCFVRFRYKLATYL